MFRKSHIFFSICLIVLTGIRANAERVRGPVVEIVTINSDELHEFSVSPRDLVAVFVESDSRILQGFQVDLRLSPAMAAYRDGFIVTVYEQIFPDPTRQNMNYSAINSSYARIQNATQNRFVVSFSDAMTTGDMVRLLAGRGYPTTPYIISIDPISKALPDSLAAESIGVVIRGIFKELGILKLKIVSADADLPPFIVEIDGEARPFFRDGYALLPGNHTVRVSSEDDFEQVEQIEITRGDFETVTVQLGNPLPTVMIDAPEDAAVFLDGQRYRQEIHGSVEVAAGEHIVLIQMGDYAISRRFTVENDRNYIISLFLDIIIDETR